MGRTKTESTTSKKPAKPKFRVFEDADQIKIPINLPKPTRGRSLSKANKIKISTFICQVYALDKYPLDSITPFFGVGIRTFYDWTKEFAEIAQLYKEAKEEKDQVYFHTLRERARTALEKKVTGEVIILKSKKYRTPLDKEGKEIKGVVMMSETTEKEVYVQPSDTAIIYALNNQDGGNFQRNPVPEAQEDQNVNIPPINWIEE